MNHSAAQVQFKAVSIFFSALITTLTLLVIPVIVGSDEINSYDASIEKYGYLSYHHQI